MIDVQLPTGGTRCRELNRADPCAQKICTKTDDDFGFVKMKLRQAAHTVRLLVGIRDGRGRECIRCYLASTGELPQELIDTFLKRWAIDGTRQETDGSLGVTNRFQLGGD